MFVDPPPEFRETAPTPLQFVQRMENVGVNKDTHNLAMLAVSILYIVNQLIESILVLNKHVSLLISKIKLFLYQVINPEDSRTYANKGKKFCSFLCPLFLRREIIAVSFYSCMCAWGYEVCARKWFTVLCSYTFAINSK